MKKQHRDWVLKNRERRTAYQKDWRKRNPVKTHLSEREFRETHKEYYRFIDYAKYHFPLDEECMLCGTTENLQRHHPRYFNYNVEYAWIFSTLCLKHHTIEDKYRNEWTVKRIG